MCQKFEKMWAKYFAASDGVHLHRQRPKMSDDETLIFLKIKMVFIMMKYCHLPMKGEVWVSATMVQMRIIPGLPKHVLHSLWFHIELWGQVLQIGFGPPSTDFGSIWSSQKARKFRHVQKYQKCVLCILTPDHLTIINYCCPTVFYSINKAASISSGICFVP